MNDLISRIDSGDDIEFVCNGRACLIMGWEEQASITSFSDIREILYTKHYRDGEELAVRHLIDMKLLSEWIISIQSFWLHILCKGLMPKHSHYTGISKRCPQAF